MTYPEAVEHKCVVPMEVNWNPVMATSQGNYDDILDRERYGIWQNAHRNAIIAERAHHYSDHGDQVLVIVSKVEHAMFLKKHLPDFTLCYGELDPKDRRWYISEGLIPEKQPQMTLDRRLMLTRAFRAGRLKKVIATGVWNRGVDFRNLGVLIRADAQSSPIADIQIPGRLSRTAVEAGKEVGIVEDFMDQFDKALAERARRRRSNYKSYGWTQLIPSRKNMSRMEQTYLFQ
jgi:superfamily II DNA or RNA helicase